MPTIPLTIGRHGLAISVRDPAGPTLAIPPCRLFALIEVPGHLLPRDAIIDTGAPFTIFPADIWRPFRPGLDYEILPFVGGTPPPGQIPGWQFTYRIARFLVPLALMDTGLTTRIERPGVIAQFADGNPPARPGVKALPPVIVGLWGGVLEAGQIKLDRNPTTGGMRGELAFP